MLPQRITSKKTSNTEQRLTARDKDEIVEIKKGGTRTAYRVGGSVVSEKNVERLPIASLQAQAYFDRHQQMRKTAHILTYASIVSLGIAAIPLINFNGKRDKPANKEAYNNSVLYIGLIEVGLHIPSTLLHHTHTAKAILIFYKQSARKVLELQFRPNASAQCIGVALIFQHIK